MSQATANNKAANDPSVDAEALRPTSDRPATPIDVRGETIQGRRYLNADAKPQSAAPASPAQQQAGVPRMPKIGLPEALYLKVHDEAVARGDDLTREAAKAGQYTSLALRDLDAPWAKKLKYFRHALKRHTQPPEHADEVTKAWFQKLARHVKKHAGAEALRLAAEANERFTARKSMGQTGDDIADDAEELFNDICPHCDTCPPLYNEEDWIQLKAYRDRWI